METYTFVMGLSATRTREMVRKKWYFKSFPSHYAASVVRIASLAVQSEIGDFKSSACDTVVVVPKQVENVRKRISRSHKLLDSLASMQNDGPPTVPPEAVGDRPIDDGAARIAPASLSRTLLASWLCRRSERKSHLVYDASGSREYTTCTASRSSCSISLTNFEELAKIDLRSARRC